LWLFGTWDPSSTLMAIGSLAGNVSFSALSRRSFICAIAVEEDFCGFFGAIIDFEAFSALVSLILDICAGNQEGRPLQVKRGPNCAFMTEIAYVKEGSLGSEPLGAGVKRR
jgi:hypothetical protein